MKVLLMTVTVLLLSISTAFAGYYDTYKIASYHTKQFSTSGSANISLYDSKGKLKGLLIFYSKDVSELPSASKDMNGLVRLYYTSSNFHNVLDLIRNESPINLNYWHGSGTNSHVGTASREAIGEGE